MICRTGVGDIIECQNCLIRPNEDSSKASSTPADRLSERKRIDQSVMRSTKGDLVQLVQQAKSSCVLNKRERKLNTSIVYYCRGLNIFYVCRHFLQRVPSVL